MPSHHDAEDLASDVFTEAWRSRRRLRWRQRPFEAWLFGIARRRLAAFYRNLPPPAVDIADQENHAASFVRDEFLAVEIRDLLGHLAPEHRQAVELRYIVGLSGVEAAAAMGRSHGAFRALLYRATQALLKEAQGSEGGSPDEDAHEV